MMPPDSLPALTPPAWAVRAGLAVRPWVPKRPTPYTDPRRIYMGHMVHNSGERGMRVLGANALKRVRHVERKARRASARGVK